MSLAEELPESDQLRDDDDQSGDPVKQFDPVPPELIADAKSLFAR
ncbi:MAG TPA: hypothetical protein VFZ97_04645 [Acidimicrobiales bacterium]